MSGGGMILAPLSPPREVELVVAERAAEAATVTWPVWVAAAGCVVVLVVLVHRWVALRLERDPAERALRALCRMQGVGRGERDLLGRVAAEAGCSALGVLVSDAALRRGAARLVRRSPGEAPGIVEMCRRRGVEVVAGGVVGDGARRSDGRTRRVGPRRAAG